MPSPLSETIKEIGVIVSPIILFIITYLQIRMGKKQNKIEVKQNEIHKQINGMQEKLITAEKSASKAEGEQKGAADNQAITDAKPQEKK